MNRTLLRLLSLLTALIIPLSAASIPAHAEDDAEFVTESLNGYLFGHMSWGVKHMGLDVLQEKFENSGEELPEVRVAVIDSGLNTSNRYLKGRYTEDGYNFLNNTSDFHDDQFHGTMVSGIIADATSDNVKILPLKVNDASGKGSLRNVERAIYYAIEHHADVINLSISAEDSAHTMTLLDDAIQAAVDEGIIIVAAAGNQSGNAGDRYPARKSNVLTITSIDRNNTIGENANTGDCIDFALPGVLILAPYKTGLLSSFVDSGTSLAAPHAAAAAALLKTWDKRVDQEAASAILRSYAVDLGEEGYDSTYGWGMIDLSEFDITVPYEPPESLAALIGDADGNSRIESVDATWIQRRTLGMDVPYDEPTLMQGDADGDEALTLTDATAIQYYLAQLPIPYPVGETA